MRFATLARLCAALDCRPGDLVDYDYNPKDLQNDDAADT
ncbi:helix-turn-helix domain-containing protein [Sphingomonas sp. Leaf20]